MSEYTQLEVTAALAGIVDAVDDTGVIISDRRFVEDDPEALALMQSLAPRNEAHGWFITLMQVSESDTNGGGTCEVTQTLSYVMEAVYPYQRRRTDNTTSESGFRAMLGAVIQAVRDSRNLGLDARIYHRLMQTEQDFSIENWAGEGQDSILTHFARFRLEVTNMVFHSNGG